MLGEVFKPWRVAAHPHPTRTHSHSRIVFGPMSEHILDRTARRHAPLEVLVGLQIRGRECRLAAQQRRRVDGRRNLWR